MVGLKVTLRSGVSLSVTVMRQSNLVFLVAATIILLLAVASLASPAAEVDDSSKQEDGIASFVHKVAKRSALHCALACAVDNQSNSGGKCVEASKAPAGVGKNEHCDEGFVCVCNSK